MSYYYPFIFTPGVPSNQPFIFQTGPSNQPFIFQTDNSRTTSLIFGRASYQNANYMSYYNDMFTANRNLNYGWFGY